MNTNNKISPYGKLWISALLAVIILIFSLIYGDGLDIHLLFRKLLIPMMRLFGFITLGLVVGQIIESTGWTKHLSIVARPIFRFSNLGNRCSSAFTAAFISGVISNAMLLDFYQEKKISKLQLFLTNYLNQLPAFFLHLPTTFFIVVPLTGTAGGLYFGLTFTATLLRTFSVLIFGHFYLPLRSSKAQKIVISHDTENGKSLQREETQAELSENEGEEDRHKHTSKSKKMEGVRQQIKSKLPGRIINIAVYVLPIYTLVFVLNANGFFLYLNESFSSHLTLSFMPVESLSVIMLSFAAEFTSGFAAAGALMHAGVLTTKQTVIALLLGNITAFPIRALRHQLPRYMGIFSPGMGLQLLLSSQFFRVASIIIVGTAYFCLS